MTSTLTREHVAFTETKSDILMEGFEVRTGFSAPPEFSFVIVRKGLQPISHIEEEGWNQQVFFEDGTSISLEDVVLGFGLTAADAWTVAIDEWNFLVRWGMDYPNIKKVPVNY